MSGYFKSPNEFHIMMVELSTVIGVLNQGRTGGLGSAAVHANSKGYRVTLNGRTLAKGRSPRELHENFQASIARACAEEETRQ